MREVEADHRHGPVRREHRLRGFRVGDDVELGGGRAVAARVRPSHEHDALDALDDARLLGHRERDVGERTSRDQGDGAGLGGHDLVDDDVDGVRGLDRAPRLGQDRPVQARVAVDVRRDHLRSHERAGGARRDRDVDAGDRADRQRVARDLLDRLVARARRDGHELHARVARREHHREGVVVPRVAVEDDPFH